MRRSMDFDDIIMPLILVIVVLAVVALFGALTCQAIDRGRAQDECGRRGGTVDHFDSRHDEAWRCVGATPEAR